MTESPTTMKSAEDWYEDLIRLPSAGVKSTQHVKQCCFSEKLNFIRSVQQDAIASCPDTSLLLMVLADIRQKSGVGMKPMLSELANAIAAKLDNQDLNIAYKAGFEKGKAERT